MTTALDQVKLAIAADPTLRRGVQPARPDLRQPRRPGAWPRRASSARCSSTRATPTRCTTTAGTCASRSAMPKSNALFDQALAVPQYRGVAAHAAGAGRVPGACRPARRSRGVAARAPTSSTRRARSRRPTWPRCCTGAANTSGRASTSAASTRSPTSPTRRRCGSRRASRTSSATAGRCRVRHASCATASPTRARPRRSSAERVR